MKDGQCPHLAPRVPPTPPHHTVPPTNRGDLTDMDCDARTYRTGSHAPAAVSNVFVACALGTLPAADTVPTVAAAPFAGITRVLGSSMQHATRCLFLPTKRLDCCAVYRLLRLPATSSTACSILHTFPPLLPSLHLVYTLRTRTRAVCPTRPPALPHLIVPIRFFVDAVATTYLYLRATPPHLRSTPAVAHGRATGTRGGGCWRPTSYRVAARGMPGRHTV